MTASILSALQLWRAVLGRPPAVPCGIAWDMLWGHAPRGSLLLVEASASTLAAAVSLPNGKQGRATPVKAAPLPARWPPEPRHAATRLSGKGARSTASTRPLAPGARRSNAMLRGGTEFRTVYRPDRRRAAASLARPERSVAYGVDRQLCEVDARVLKDLIEVGLRKLEVEATPDVRAQPLWHDRVRR